MANSKNSVCNFQTYIQYSAYIDGKKLNYGVSVFRNKQGKKCTTRIIRSDKSSMVGVGVGAVKIQTFIHYIT